MKPGIARWQRLYLHQPASPAEEARPYRCSGDSLLRPTAATGDASASFAFSALLDTLGPLVTNLAQLVLSVLAIRFSLLLLLCLLSHLRIVRIERLRVLLVRAIVLSQQRPLSPLILRLHLEQFSRQLLNCLLQVRHGLFMSLLHGSLNLFAIGCQLVLSGVLLGT